jgi:uncharacterized phage protein (TIGR02218 family)
MTYDIRERSVQDGAPVELYLFARNDKFWRFTSAGEDVGDSSETWVSAPITRNDIEQSTEQARNALTLTVPRNFQIADMFRIAPPSDVIALTVFRYHRGEEEDVAVIWMGRILNVSFEGAKATIRCEPVSASMKRQGLRRMYQKQCPHVLYGPGCTLNKDDFAIDTTVTSIDGVTLVVGAVGALSYGGGFIEYEDADGNLERRFIRSHVTTTLTLNFPFTGLSASDPVTIYPGCAHTMEVCDGDFGNILNYGGTPFVPDKNPFSGTPIY